MGWTETHRRWQALQEIEARANAALEQGVGPEIPWSEDYAEIFGDRAALVVALRHRWQQAQRAQLDSHLPERVLEEQWCRLRTRHAGVLRLLEQYDGATVDALDRIPA